MLTPQVMAAHHLAKKKPISIVPAKQVGRQDYPGLVAGHLSEFDITDETWAAPGRVRIYPAVVVGKAVPEPAADLCLSLPWVDSQLFHLPPTGSKREGELVWSGNLLKLGKQLRDEHATLPDLSPFAPNPMTADARANALCEAECVYCYGTGAITTEARLCGCKVIYIPTDWQLHAVPNHPIATLGAFFENFDQPINTREGEQSFFHQYQNHVASAQHSLSEFIAISQRLAAAQVFEEAWSDADVDSLGDLVTSTPEVKAARADRRMYKSLSDTYVGWKAKTSPREVYADIAAQYISARSIQQPAVHVYAQGWSMDDLANVLDDLALGWLQPSVICIHADHACPVDPSDLGGQVEWHDKPGGFQHPIAKAATSSVEWCVLIDAGTRLEPYTLYELLKVSRSSGDAVVAYGADDIRQRDGSEIPNLKGGGNVELLRHTNYLGGVVAVKESAWSGMPDRHLYSTAYRVALEYSALRAGAALLYVDKVISHQPLRQHIGAETEEFNVVRDVLSEHWPGTKVLADEISGCWKVTYPKTTERVTAVVPTGNQLGYLEALLKSINRLESEGIDEIVLVTRPEDLVKTLDQIGDRYSHLDIRCIAGPTEAFNLGAYLNAAIKVASHSLILVCDDDVEFLAGGTTATIASYFVDSHVAVVSPRQVLQVEQKPLLTGGPCLVGNDACLVQYNGQQQWLAERGFLNRLQMAQDVAGVQGSCYMLRKSAHCDVNGFNESDMRTFCTATDFGYKLIRAGYRIVWTPDASFHHTGGATLRSLRKDPDTQLLLHKQWIGERDELSRKWLRFASSIDLYSKHLSREIPYGLEPSMVIEWDIRSKDRPRVLAQPISSGSGQYRVIEPLDAIQSASLAETALIFPDSSKKRRIVSVTDIAIAKPDRVLLQHSISDEDISNLKNIRKILPDTFVIQLMDDLVSDLPSSHPNFNYGMREGHTRTVEAVRLCNRLIVSTQPLADYYKSYCDDIVVVPNALDERMWGHHFKPVKERARLRIGWAGAAQHQGDLTLITDVLKHFADKVDWIFMGMCPDVLRPMIKEFHSFVSYSDYPAKLATLDLDIAIAPLEDNAFNQCKSNLRLLEYGAMGWPVVCSDVYPFRTGKPPVISCANNVDDWIDAISLLINDFSLRQAMGVKLNDWLKRNYMLSNIVTKWNTAIFS
ncbi:MAG: glycosyltransferase [Rhodoferax sp.]|nr:glycosyltransferase [Rhodoferax sp.]